MKLRNILPIVIISVLIFPLIPVQAASSPITVSASPGTIRSGTDTTISYTLPDIINGNMIVRINDSSDHTVWSTYLPGQHSGSGAITWNGKDNGGNNVPDGQYTVKLTVDNGIFGTSGTGDGQFDFPINVAVDSAGNIYVADIDYNRIQVFDHNGNYQMQFGTSGTGDGQLNGPVGVVIDNSGNIYVADTGNNRIQVFDHNGNYQTQFGTPGTDNGQFYVPFDVILNSTGYIYVSDFTNNRIQVFDHNGNYQTQFGTSGTGNGQLSFPRGMAIDSAGNIYVADANNNRIQVFDHNGNYQTQFGTSGTGNGQLSHPFEVAVDSTGNIYVADMGNSRIQVFDHNGNYQTQFGTSGTGNGQLFYPRGVAVDSTGNIYVADSNNKRIQVFYQGVEGVASVTVDNTAPVTTATLSGNRQGEAYTSAATATLAATDSTSGVDYTEYMVNGGNWLRYTGPITLDSTCTVSYRSADLAGNLEAEKTLSVTRVYPPPGTISMDEMYGRQQTATATPTATAAPTPTATATPVVTSTATASATAVPTISPSPVASPTAAPEETSQGSGYLLWLALGLIAVIAIAAGGYYLFFRK